MNLRPNQRIQPTPLPGPQDRSFLKIAFPIYQGCSRRSAADAQAVGLHRINPAALEHPVTLEHTFVCITENGTQVDQELTLRYLSLTARLAVALICFERYCRAHQLITHEIKVFLDYLWDFPIVNGPLSFRAWERQQPDLVTVGLGGDIPDTYLVWLHDAGISSDTFRRLVEHTVEIIYGSFYAAADDEEAHMHLQHVLAITEQNENISGLLSQFSQSRFIDRQGWGIPLSEAERDGWRVRAKATDA